MEQLTQTSIHQPTTQIKYFRSGFPGPVYPSEASLLQQAMLQKAGKKAIPYLTPCNMYPDDGYPLVQCQIVEDTPHIMALNEGVGWLYSLFEAATMGYAINHRPLKFIANEIDIHACLLSITRQQHTYTLCQWQPFGSQLHNYYRKLRTPAKRQLFLQQLLRSHLQCFASAMGLHAVNQIEAAIIACKEQSSHHDMTTFDLTFHTNMELPACICLGRQAALGYGIVRAVV